MARARNAWRILLKTLTEHLTLELSGGEAVRLEQVVRPQATHTLCGRQVARNPCSEKLDQLRIHELVFVGNLQTDDASTDQVRLELG